MRASRRPYRSSQLDNPVRPRGLFGGNRSVRMGLVVVIACILIVQLYNRAHRQVLTGPIDDALRRSPAKLVIIYGTGGTGTGALANYAHQVSRLFGQRLKRDILVYPDTEADDDLLKNYTLLLYGPVEQNVVAQKLKGFFPFKFSGSGVYLGQKYVSDPNWRLIFVFPNPYNKNRYVLVYTGATTADVVGINLLENPNFVHHDTTDYVLAVGSRIVRQGHFDKSDPSRWAFE